VNQHQKLSQLLRWQFEQSAIDAPPPPHYNFVEREAPIGWQMAPGAFQKLLRLLDALPAEPGFAADPDGNTDQPTVPVVVATGVGSEVTRGEILYFNIAEGRLRLRFRLKPPLAKRPERMRVIFVSNVDMTPVLEAWALPGVDEEFRLEESLLPTLERDWSELRATSHMPFRLILQAGESETSSSD
jgi:hypothetical protein